jgi:hypothetical protein
MFSVAIFAQCNKVWLRFNDNGLKASLLGQWLTVVQSI